MYFFPDLPEIINLQDSDYSKMAFDEDVYPKEIKKVMHLKDSEY